MHSTLTLKSFLLFFNTFNRNLKIISTFLYFNASDQNLKIISTFLYFTSFIWNLNLISFFLFHCIQPKPQNHFNFSLFQCIQLKPQKQKQKIVFCIHTCKTFPCSIATASFYIVKCKIVYCNIQKKCRFFESLWLIIFERVNHIYYIFLYEKYCIKQEIFPCLIFNFFFNFSRSTHSIL